MTHITSVAWSPNGKQIAVGRGSIGCDADGNRHSIQIIDAGSEQVVKNLTAAKCSISSLDWSPDSTKLAASSLDDIGIRVWDVQSGQLVIKVQGDREGITSVKWRPTDGLQLAYADTYKNKIGVLDTITGKRISIAPIEGSTVDWSPDGNRLVSGSQDSSSIATISPDDNQVYVTDMVTAQEILALNSHSGDVETVDWSPDGTKLASSTYDLRLWDAVSGQPLLTINTNPSDVQWSPDSQKLATVNSDGVAQIWDAATGLLLESFVHLAGLRAVAWSPDGKQIAYGGEAIDENEPQVQIVDVQQETNPTITATSSA